MLLLPILLSALGMAVGMQHLEQAARWWNEKEEKLNHSIFANSFFWQAMYWQCAQIYLARCTNQGQVYHSGQDACFPPLTRGPCEKVRVLSPKIAFTLCSRRRLLFYPLSPGWESVKGIPAQTLKRWWLATLWFPKRWILRQRHSEFPNQYWIDSWPKKHLQF